MYSAHRWAMLRNMVTSLIHHERIMTTTPKAKELRRVADQCVGYAKEGHFFVYYLLIHLINRYLLHYFLRRFT